MIKKVKKTTVFALSTLLLLQMFMLSAFASDVSITLSAESGYKGDNITISGTYGTANAGNNCYHPNDLQTYT